MSLPLDGGGSARTGRETESSLLVQPSSIDGCERGAASIFHCASNPVERCCV